ncbi:MAG: hypothetical protein JKX73_09180, partial [Flavobacteriales bacterium]|nr:hypothetical protein [Flavobacteriales bacterium]
FGKDSPREYISDEVIFSSKCDFELPNKEWKGDESGVSDVVSRSGTKAFNMTANMEYSLTFSEKIEDVFINHENVLNASVWGYLEEADDDATLVITLESEDGEVYDWRGMNFSCFIDKAISWTKVFHSWRFDYIRSGSDRIKVYVWNHKKDNIFIDDLKIDVGAGNPLIFGKAEKTF